MRGLHHVKPHDLLYDMLGEEWDPAEAAWQSIIHVCPFPTLCWAALGRRCKLARGREHRAAGDPARRTQASRRERMRHRHHRRGDVAENQRRERAAMAGACVARRRCPCIRHRQDGRARLLGLNRWYRRSVKSRDATRVRGGFGGWEGRSLKGDRLSSVPNESPATPWSAGSSAPSSCRTILRWEVRAIAGPDEYLFTSESVQTFVSRGLDPQSEVRSDRPLPAALLSARRTSY